MSIALRRIARGTESVQPADAAELAVQHNNDADGLHTLSEYFNDQLISELRRNMLEEAGERGVDAYVVTAKRRQRIPIGFVFGAPLPTEMPTYEVGAWIDFGARGQGFGVQAIRKYLEMRSVDQRPAEAQFVISATDLVIPARPASDFTALVELPYPYNKITDGFDLKVGVPAGMLVSGAALMSLESGLLPRDIKPLIAALQIHYKTILPEGWSIHAVVKDGKTSFVVGFKTDLVEGDK